MKTIAKYTTIICLMMTLISCASKPAYMVEIYDIDKEHLHRAKDIISNSKSALSKYNARMLGDPLIVVSELENSALPSYTKQFPGNAVYVWKFPNKNLLRNYLNSSKSKELLHKMKEVSNHQYAFVAKEFNPMGMLPSKPELGSISKRQDPAFMMLNAITMKSFWDPRNPYYIARFISKNEPKLIESGVRVLMPLKKKKNIVGSFDYEILFFTEWPSVQFFNNYHEESSFVELTRKTRNKAMTGFTESKAGYFK